MDSRRTITRRDWLSGTVLLGGLTVLPAARIWGRSRSGINGVAVGAISYSFRELPGHAGKVLDYLVACKLDCVELMGDAAEEFAGAPPGPPFPAAPAGQSPDAAAVKAYWAERQRVDAERSTWRRSVPMDRYRKLRRMYDEARVRIDILKLGEASWSDADINYAYDIARILGARGISFEADEQAAQRMGPFAERHRMINGMHNHAQFADPKFDADKLLAYSKANRLNFDVGHYVGTTGRSPVEFLEKYHARISHLHLKDRKTPANGGANLPWGQGDTPLRDVLRLVQKQRWPIPAMIELEYALPAGSTVLAEVRKCAAYCREALS